MSHQDCDCMKTANRLTSLNNSTVRPQVQPLIPIQPQQSSSTSLEPIIDTSNDCIIKIPMTLSPGQKFAILVQCEECSKAFKKKDKCKHNI